MKSKISIFIFIFLPVIVLFQCNVFDKPKIEENPAEDDQAKYVSKTIGLDGGSLADGKGTVIDIPEGALSGDTNISVRTYDNSRDFDVNLGVSNLSCAADFKPDGLTFSKPATITFTSLTGLTAGSVFALFTYDKVNKTWINTGNPVTVQSDGVTCIAEITHFSIYSFANTIDYQIFKTILPLIQENKTAQLTLEKFRDNFLATREYIGIRETDYSENYYDLAHIWFDLQFYKKELNSEKIRDDWASYTFPSVYQTQNIDTTQFTLFSDSLDYSTSITNSEGVTTESYFFYELKMNFHWFFIKIIPKNTSKDVPVDSKIYLKFASPMYWESVKSAFSITPSINGTFADDTTRDITFTPEKDLEYETKYTVTISNAAMTNSGVTQTKYYIPANYSYSFTTEKSTTTTIPSDSYISLDSPGVFYETKLYKFGKPGASYTGTSAYKESASIIDIIGFQLETITTYYCELRVNCPGTTGSFSGTILIQDGSLTFLSGSDLTFEVTLCDNVGGYIEGTFSGTMGGTYHDVPVSNLLVQNGKFKVKIISQPVW